jgi:DNA sulfur modification protein DndB
MANVYPALKLKMGSDEDGWEYYSVKMTMEDIAKEVGFAEEFEENKTLDNIYQRARSSRAKNEMVKFLANREDRFYSSIVVAARGGAPTFADAKPQSEELRFFYDGQDDFGLLKFDGGQNYYALDGQHRLTSIKTLLDTSEPGKRHLDNIGVSVPSGFRNESVSVIIVTTSGDDEEWRKKYRRLFSALNRNAKPVDPDTIIAMDEDDLFCILTRQLIMEHEFFFWNGEAAANEKVQCKGGNIAPYVTGRTAQPAKSCVTTLQALKDMNIELLKTTANESRWANDPFSNKQIKLSQFIQNRPSDEEIDEWYGELSLVWDSLLEALPDLANKDPQLMRTNNCDDDTIDHLPGSENNALFRPVVQKEILAPLARMMLNEDEAETKDEMVNSLQKLANINWSLFDAPWRYLILDKNENGEWKMTNEDRTKRSERLLEILQWSVGLIEKEDIEIAELKGYYKSYLNCSEEEQESLWQDILDMKERITD